MKPLFSSFAFLSLASVGFAQTTVTLDGASGSQSYNIARSTNGGLSMGLEFQVEYLVIGGGGSGGTGGGNGGQNTWGAGGGGAGGFVAGSFPLFYQSYDVIVGAGGTAPAYSAGSTSTGVNGQSSQFGQVIALGGGGGGGGENANSGVGRNGASGGGGGSKYSNAGGNGTASQGFGGGTARGGDTSSAGDRTAGGGGGGAGGAGNNAAPSSSTAGAGGVGLISNITGTSVTYAGGGGGGARDLWGGQAAGAGGTGGGGAGSTQGNATNGTNGLGGGGGGSGADGKGGNGGSGVVIVRYKGASAGTGGTIVPGTGTASGYTIHTFSTTGGSSLNLSNLNLSTRLGAVQAAPISGSGDFTFTGPGTLTLQSTNTYTGTTRVNAGTLALGSSGSIGTSAGISIANGANFNVSTVAGGFILGGTQNLSGGGTISGDVTIAGTHTPGFSPGLQTFTDNLTYASGSSIVWELNSNALSGRGTNFDGIDVGGDLSFSGSTSITLNFGLSGSTLDWNNALWNTDITGTSGWKIFSVAGDITDFGNLQLTTNSWVDGSGKTLASVRPDASFSLFEGVDGVYLNYSAVPEPTSLVLALLSGIPLLRRKRA